jgi:ABC-type transport system involved in cytochrome bd biosynthesis fused ATPase/permease subunit
MGTLILTSIGFVLVVVYFFLFGSNVNRLGKMTNKYSANLIQSLKEGLSGKKEVFVYGKTSQFSDEIKKSATLFAKFNRDAIFITTSPKIMVEFLIVVGLIVATIVIVQFPEQQYYTLPFFSALSVAGLRIIPGTYVLMSGLLNLQHTRPSVENLVEEIKQLDISNKETRQHNLVSLGRFETLELKSVGFSYEGQSKSTLNEIDLMIKKRSLITIMGASGSGKSTLLDVILGLIKPSQGAVLVNGTPIEKIGANWTKTIAFCPQQPLIFKKSLVQNISLDFNETEKNSSFLFKDERFQSAVKNAGLDHATLERLRNNGNKIADGGSNISGGQLQRIGLARSLYSGRELLVLDEPTSALDLMTEKTVFERLKFLTQEKTIIIASHSQLAHDLSEQVYLLSDGRLKRIK